MNLIFRWTLLAIGLVVAVAGVHAAPLLPAPELAADGRVEVAAHAGLVEDAQSTLLVADVRQRFESGQVTAAPAAGINLGYTKSAWWVGFRVPAHAAGNPRKDRLMEIGFPTLDHVEFYRPGATAPVVVGDHYPFGERPIRHRNFVFDLPADTPDNAWVLLRVRSEGTLSVPLTLWTPSTARNAAASCSSLGTGPVREPVVAGAFDTADRALVTTTWSNPSVHCGAASEVISVAVPGAIPAVGDMAGDAAASVPAMAASTIADALAIPSR